MKPRVYVTRSLPYEVIRELAEEAEVRCYAGTDEPVPRSVLLQEVRGVDAILSLLTDRIDGEVFAAAGPALKIVANMAVGYDNIDVAEAVRRGIAVTNTPDVLTETTADLVFGLLLATARRLPESERFLRAGQWRSWSPFLLAGRDVYGKTIGIVGLGRIGAAVARRASGFSMRVVYYSRHRKPDLERTLGCEYVDLDSLLSVSDYVVVLSALTADTRGLIGRDQLAKMKRTAVLVNASRGPVVDEQALIEALQAHIIWAAGLDVYEQEPLPPDHPLLKLDNVVLLPHIGSASVETRMEMARLAVRNIQSVLHGEGPLNPVHAPGPA